jgi:hypothetical protein
MDKQLQMDEEIKTIITGYNSLLDTINLNDITTGTSFGHKWTITKTVQQDGTIDQYVDIEPNRKLKHYEEVFIQEKFGAFVYEGISFDEKTTQEALNKILLIICFIGK